MIIDLEVEYRKQKRRQDFLTASSVVAIATLALLFTCALVAVSGVIV